MSVIATRGEQLVGNTLVLVFALADGRALTVSEDGADWIEIAKELPSHLPGAQPYEKWSLDVAFSAPAPKGVLVFQR